MIFKSCYKFCINCIYKRLKYFLISVFLCICSINTFAKKTEYQVYVGFPKGYISEYNNKKSILKDEKGNIITRFGGENATVGMLGSGVQNSGRGKMEVPSKIEVMWFSTPEDQFWHGEFELPTKMLEQLLVNEKMLGLFLTQRTKMIDKYDQIIVNVAPKGKVYIYVGGAATKLVGIYQAQPIKYDWETHIRETWAISGKEVITHKEYLEDVRNSNKDIISKIFSNYNEGYFKPVKWQIKVNGENNKLLAFVTDTLNGENINILDKPSQQIIESIPKEIAIDLKHEDVVKRYNITFPNLYEFYHKNFDPQKVVTVLIDFPNKTQCFVYFQQGDKKIEIKDIVVEELDR